MEAMDYLKNKRKGSEIKFLLESFSEDENTFDTNDLASWNPVKKPDSKNEQMRKRDFLRMKFTDFILIP